MTKNDIIKLCKQYKIKNYTINSDMSVDVDGNVNLFGKSLTELLLTFGKVTGYFDCSNNYLTSLKGCPHYVGGSFYCGMNHLSSLKNCPEKVRGSFNCHKNNITTRNLMITVGGNIYSEILWKF